MCGLTGIFSRTSIPNIEVRVQAMNESIIHRGPDAGSHFCADKKLALGHRRLSIIDTAEHSNQPMQSNSKRWHLVFNGEIYNYEEIRTLLDYDFHTLSDTEVILAAVEQFGFDWFLEKANGMFAIVLYDSLNKELFIVRDRMGIKPLFISRQGSEIVFSSEIKAILHSGLVEAKFNEDAVDEYLANRYVRAPFTFFNGIEQVSPGTYLKFDENLNENVVTYWKLPSEFNMDSEFNEADIKQGLKDNLERSINYRLIADVPLGTYLSGGIDSSLITAITCNNKKEPVNTYTIGFPELNEFEYSEIIAEKYKTDHHEILMTKDDYVNNWDRLIKYKDAPLGVPNEIPLAVMSSKLKEKITVVLSGEGADELMGGYGRIFRSPFEYIKAQTEESFYDYFIQEYEYVPRVMRDNLLNTSKRYRDVFDEKIKKEFSSKPNEENVFRFFHSYHVKGLLQRVDMTTMQTSVEARVPFLDHKLIEYSYRNIPYNLKLKWKNKEAEIQAQSKEPSEYSEVLDTPKYLLRELAYDYLPKEIVDRKKVGFPVPLTEWFENMETLALELLADVSWLKPGVVNELVEKSKKEVRAGQILWMFINIELFKKSYFNKSWIW